MGRIQNKLRLFAASVLDIPMDVVHDLPRVTMIGNRQIYIENHRGVLHFNQEGLQLSLSAGQLVIKGSDLVIRAILPEEVFVEGTIDHIDYIKGQE